MAWLAQDLLGSGENEEEKSYLWDISAGPRASQHTCLSLKYSYFKKEKPRLREGHNLTQATQLKSNWLSGHWNPNVSGFKNHALSCFCVPFHGAVGGTLVWVRPPRCVILGGSFKRLSSVSSATKSSDHFAPHRVVVRIP